MGALAAVIIPGFHYFINKSFNATAALKSGKGPVKVFFLYR